MRKHITQFVILFLLGSIINVVLAWSLFHFVKVDSNSINITSGTKIKDRLPQHVFVRPNLFDFIEYRVIGSGYSYFTISAGTQAGSNVVDSTGMLYGLYEAGWPVPTLSGTYFMTANGLEYSYLYFIVKETIPYRTKSNTLPFRPIWPGFIINTGFYGGILWVLFCGPFVLRRRRRRKRNQCVKCGYPKGDSDVCTECGFALKRVASNAAK